MGFSDSPNKSIFHTPEKKDSQYHNNPIKGCKIKPKELFETSPENERSVSRFDDRRTEEEAAGISSLDLKLPPVAAEGFSTPTGLAQRDTSSLVCPPAPRKPKSVLLPEKGKMGCRKRVFLDLTNDVDSLFPAAVRADFGNKIKKVRN